MTRIKRNLLANFVGSGWTALLNLALIPVYVHFMGIEAYGLMGVFYTLSVALNLLDVGLSPTLNRELARMSTLSNKATEMRNLVRTIESGYWAMAGLICVAGFVLAPLIARYWLHANLLPESTVVTALAMMGLVITFQWPISLYSGGLQGLQKQVILNTINVVSATIRGVGSVLTLWLVSPTIQAFLVWQMITSLLQTTLLAVVLWLSLPKSSERPRFQLALLRQVWRFAAGMSGIAVVSVILSLMDKVILSKMLPLEAFGYYTLASTLAFSIQRLVVPVFDATFPRLSQLVLLGDIDQLRSLYHRTCQLISVITLPVACVIALFSAQVMWLWTRNSVTVANTSLLVSLLVTGFALNGLMNLPYALQLAHGWTKLAFYQNVIAVVLLVPALIVAVNALGAPGAAMIWVVLNAGSVLITIPVMHRKLLPGEQGTWYRADIGMPLIAALAITVFSRLLLPASPSSLALILWLALTLILSTTLCVLVVPSLRGWVSQLFMKRIITRSWLREARS